MDPVQPMLVADAELQRALDCGELVRCYQPVYDLATGDVAQVEALLRWEQRDGAVLTPGEFLPGHDDSTLLVRIGWSVVIGAVQRAAEWRHRFPDSPVVVSVNLFDSHLALRELPNRVERLVDHHLDGGPGLAFEVGEHHAKPPRSRTRDRLTIIRNLGAAVVVDDFGAAAAATDDDAGTLRDDACERLESLRSFPLDVVKLAPAFVERLGDDERRRTVVDAAHASGIAVCALAVEDDAGDARARRAGCDLGQGFRYGRPTSADDVAELLAAR